MSRALAVVAAASIVAGGAWLVRGAFLDAGGASLEREAQAGPIPVQVARVERGMLEARRRYAGALEPAAAFVVTAKVSGRVETVRVELGDVVERGAVVVELDDAELVQAAAEARAAVAVARAEKAAADSALTVAERTAARIERLVSEGVGTVAEGEAAEAELLRARAGVEVAVSQVVRATASLRAAEVRAGYAKAKADWSGDDSTRVVAERFVDEGQDVAQNAPLVSVVDLDPVVVVVHVTEKDYADLGVGKDVAITTDAYPGETFSAKVARIAPMFSAESRQARVELEAPNPDGRLKPGMFVRAEVVVDRVDSATIVPEDALVTRKGQKVVFVVSEDGARVMERPVRVGLADAGRVAVEGDGIEGRVVTLGQQALTDGARITVPERRVAPTGSAGSEDR